MNKQLLLIIMIFTVFYSCKHHAAKKVTVIETPDSFNTKLKNAESKTINASGKFIDISENQKLMRLNVKGDTLIFVVAKLLDEEDISLLKKTKDDIKLGYIEYYDSSRNIKLNLVEYIERGFRFTTK